MKGINPFYFYLSKGIIVGMVFLMVYNDIVNFKWAIIVAFLLIIVIVAFMTYQWKKISKINKGKPIKSAKGKIGSWHYILVGIIIAFGGYLIEITYQIGSVWTMASILLLLGFIVSNFNQTHYITIYENGAVFEGTAYYDWNEIEKIKNGDKTIWKIKNIPKEIIINES